MFYYVNEHLIGLGSLEKTITHNIGCGGVRSRRAHTPKVINEIYPKFYSGAVRIIFLRAVVYQNISICNVFAALTWDILYPTKKMMSIPLTLLPTPCANLPSLFTNECFQNFCVGHIL